MLYFFPAITHPGNMNPLQYEKMTLNVLRKPAGLIFL